MIFDTNVLIKLEREAKRKVPGIATAFFAALPETRMCITPTIAGELCCGLSMSKRSVWESFCAGFELLPITSNTAWHYGELFRHLSATGALIGSNDLWIAATALTHDVPLATANVNEFSRVPNLHVVPVK